MKPLLKHMMQLFLLWLILYCLGMSILYHKNNNRDSILMLYQKGNPINGAQALKMLEREEEEAEAGETGIDFTVWGIQNKTELKTEELGREANGTAYFIAGDVSLLFRHDGFLLREDTQGCLLSKDLAYKLFGSVDIVGLSLTASGQTLTVRGILQEAEGAIVINAGEDTGKIMDAAIIRIPEGVLASSIIHSFQNRHGFGTDAALPGIVKDMANLVVMLLPVCMGSCLFIPWCKALNRNRHMGGSISKFLFYPCLLGGICFLLFYTYIAEISFQIPQDYLPTNWSDFSFWSNLAKEKKNELLTLFTIEKREPERILMDSFLQTVKYSVFTLMIYITFIKHMAIKTTANLYAYVFSSICFTYGIILMEKEYARILAGDKRLWLLLPVCLAGGYILNVIEKVKGNIQLA